MRANADSISHDTRLWVRQWRSAAALAVVSVLVIVGLFWEEAAGAFRVWVGSETYQHCFFILPLSLFMIWRRRHELIDFVPCPDLRALPLICLLAIVWAIASILGILEAQQFIVVTIIQATLWAVLGLPAYKRLKAPFLYLYFLVPTGEFLVPPLQEFTARFAVMGLELLGIPVYSDGIIIEVPSGVFVVAEACAGLRFLIAAFAFGVFYATEMYRSRVRRLIFIALSIVVPIVANGFRALGLILIAEVWGDAAAVEADHLTFGWIFFSIVLIALILLGRTFSDYDLEQPPVKSHSITPATNRSMSSFVRIALLSISAAGIIPLTLAVLDNPREAIAAPIEGPEVNALWQENAEPALRWRPRIVGSDHEYLQSYTDGQRIVQRFIALYAPGGRRDRLIRSENRIADLDDWQLARRGRAQIGSVDVMTSVDETEIVSGSQRLLVWSFYVVSGEPVVGLWQTKWSQLLAYLTGNSCYGLFVAVATETLGDRDSATSALKRYLEAMEPLDRFACN